MSPNEKRPSLSPTEASLETPSKSGLTVVGIGASAGGLAALKTLFHDIPRDSGLVFVVVVHLSPEHESHLADLLQPNVRIPVQQVSETTAIETNHVYVIPPGRNISAIDTHLRLSDLEERRQERAPIDHFFRTLASVHDGHAIGVILSGTGSDGTLGIRDIKARGGLTIVQDPNDAEYDGMPQSAIATGVVDSILPIKEIASAILNFARAEPKIPVPLDGETVEGEQRLLLQKIFVQLRARSGRDFSRYKLATIMRRISRRMQLNQIEEFADYVEKLRLQPEEVRALSDDLLITVTNFFRDTEVFEKLEKEIVPQIFEDTATAGTVRVWSVGCATGEEAYSLAMLLIEENARRDKPVKIQVFASDVHERSLNKAREGVYPEDIETDVSPERLKRFFHKQNGGYRVRKEVRETVIFSPHNLLSDPPFSRISLISCRNLLIYLQREVQRDVVELFHYALSAKGYLILGTSEVIETLELFHAEDKASRIYRKRNVPAPELRLPVFPTTRAQMNNESLQNDFREHVAAYGALHQRMVERYAPPSVLVSPDGQIVHFSEHVGIYFEHSGGEPTANVFKLVRKEFRMELRSLIHDVMTNQKPRRSAPISVIVNGEPRSVVIHVHPASEPQQEGFALVIFEEWDQLSPPAEGVSRQADVPGTRKAQDLQAELELSRQRLQAVLEEHEASREEMKASNEELQSTNEELRSTLEELETSKEELQSMNEELQTVNQENRHKVEELALLSGDLQNLLSATEIATLFLDREFRIRRFTPKVGDLFNIRISDRGRPITDLTHRLGYDQMKGDAQSVLDRLVPVERQLQDETGRWFLTRIHPYRSNEDRIDGVVITFVDITEQKRSEEALRDSDKRKDEFLAVLAHELRNPLSPIRTATEILRSAQDSDVRVRATDALGRQVTQLARLVDDLLDVSRVSLGLIRLRREAVQVAQSAKQAGETVKPLCEAREQKLSVDVADNLYVSADPVRLTQILTNLLSNACKFTKDGGEIKVSAQDEAGLIAIRVQDSGSGIHPSQISRIFEMFTQVDGSIEKNESGLGIGLTLAKHLAELHGGTLEAHSEGLGLGSTFILRLSSFSGPQPRKSQVSDDLRSEPTAQRILVVDDNHDSADSLATLLRMSGNDTTTAYDGLEALEVAARFEPRVVFLDLGLPKLNGYQTARQLRLRHPERKVTIVAVSGWNQPEDFKRSREAGFDAHLVKPVALSDLENVLAKLD